MPLARIGLSPSYQPLQEVKSSHESSAQASEEMDIRFTCAVCKQNAEGHTFCSACGGNFCDNCWGTQIAHQPGGAADLRHEKSDRRITERLQGILNPATDPNTQQQLHLDDSHTTWLRWTKGSRQEPEIQEYDRYKKLIQASFSSQWKERWPQLVSFIGETGKALQIAPPASDHDC